MSASKCQIERPRWNLAHATERSFQPKKLPIEAEYAFISLHRFGLRGVSFRSTVTIGAVVLFATQSSPTALRVYAQK